jgi:hypothetical protein
MILWKRTAIELSRQRSQHLYRGPLKAVCLSQRLVQVIMARSLLHTVALRPAEDSIAAFNALFRDDARRKEVNKVRPTGA